MLKKKKHTHTHTPGVDIPELHAGGYLHGNLFPALERRGETAEFTVLSHREVCSLMFWAFCYGSSDAF